MSRAQPDASAARPGRALGLLLAGLLLAACAGTRTSGPGDAPPDAAAPDPVDPGTVVVQVSSVGGYTSAEELHGRLPPVTVYADGRVISPGPVALVYPAFAWPGLTVTQLDPGRLPDLVDRALAAGVGEDHDLGPTGVTDAPSTRFTVLTDGGTVVREVDALQEGLGSPMLSEQQRADRQRLAALAEELAGLADPAQPWSPSAVAVLAHPYTEGLLGPGGAPLDLPEVAWTGPDLPGEPLGAGLGCVVAPVEEVRAAASGASTATPWTTPDGARWSLTFRPLLPHESGCADLTG
ncbi:hypothetical protein GCU67_16185 [Modestobacter muralis]|uniref:GerMN domain-containing protein n=1 Tax=Modestobacter muralis TaxID=1608614 RepID=A0A6P0H9V4_9ACTN|nr:hypothetical protein [Modestobacter muralis]NEK95693.1 hypothetical protein [Modestobacter muralis]NEN52581.1 hypothetical protein [Modestobacter muralis]